MAAPEQKMANLPEGNGLGLLRASAATATVSLTTTRLSTYPIAMIGHAGELSHFGTEPLVIIVGPIWGDVISSS